MIQDRDYNSDDYGHGRGRSAADLDSGKQRFGDSVQPYRRQSDISFQRI